MASQQKDTNQVSGRKASENLQNDENTGRQKAVRQERQDASRNNQSERKELHNDKKRSATRNQQSCEDEKLKKGQEKRIDEEINRDYFDPVR